MSTKTQKHNRRKKILKQRSKTYVNIPERNRRYLKRLEHEQRELFNYMYNLLVETGNIVEDNSPDLDHLKEEVVILVKTLEEDERVGNRKIEEAKRVLDTDHDTMDAFPIIASINDWYEEITTQRLPSIRYLLEVTKNHLTKGDRDE